jgi:hypothetical protein
MESANLNAVKKKSFFSKTKIVAEWLLYKKRSVLKEGIQRCKFQRNMLLSMGAMVNGIRKFSKTLEITCRSLISPCIFPEPSTPAFPGTRCISHGSPVYYLEPYRISMDLPVHCCNLPESTPNHNASPSLSLSLPWISHPDLAAFPLDLPSMEHEISSMTSSLTSFAQKKEARRKKMILKH